MSADRLRQQGVSLIEVLVAVLVISIGLLGIAGLQGATTQSNLLAMQYAQAALLAQSMAESMRANAPAAIAGRYALNAGDVPPEPPLDCSQAACDSDELAAWDLARWFSALAEVASPYANIPPGPTAALPGARASIRCQDAPCTADSVHLITIYWDANRSGATGYGCDPDVATDLACVRLPVLP